MYQSEVSMLPSAFRGLLLPSIAVLFVLDDFAAFVALDDFVVLVDELDVVLAPITLPCRTAAAGSVPCQPNNATSRSTSSRRLLQRTAKTRLR